MNDKSSKITDKVNVTMHRSSIANREVSYARVQRTTVYIGNVIDKILEKENLMSRESLLYAAGVLRNGILDLLKSGNAVDLLEIGTLFIKPTGSMNTLTPDITDVPELTVSFTPSALATQAVQNVVINADITKAKIPVITSFFNISKESDTYTGQAGDTIRISGEYLKIAGTDTQTTGVFFAPVLADGSHSQTESDWLQVTEERLINNTNSWLMFNLPQEISVGDYTIIVRTANSSSNKPNKTTKTGISSQPITITA